MNQLAHGGVLLLEFLFFAGLLGSTGVVILSFAEDVHELFAGDEHD